MRGLILVQTLVLAAQHGWALPQGGGELSPDLCPAADGYFPDPIQCDKYYECVDGVPTEKLCPDGQAFKDDNPKREVCEYLFNVKCGLRVELQPPQATPNCPRANGYFAHPDDTICNEFYYCSSGLDAHNKCPDGLHFSKVSGTCGWKPQAGRTGCVDVQTLKGFECPVVNHHKAVQHPRYRDPSDCKLFFVCFNGEGPPRQSGCDLGLVFDEQREACANPREVPECATYYEEYFADYFANLHGVPADENHIAVASLAGHPVPEEARRKVEPVTRRPINTSRRRTSATAAHSPRITELTSEVKTADDAPHRFETPVESTRPNIRPASRPRPSLSSAAAKDPAKPESTRRRVRPGATRRRKKPVSTTTTTTTTTTAAPEYDYYYDEADYYYYEDTTAPAEGGAVVEEVPTTTTTTTTTPPPPPPTTIPRRRLPADITRRRPVRPGRRQPQTE